MRKHHGNRGNSAVPGKGRRYYYGVGDDTYGFTRGWRQQFAVISHEMSKYTN